MTTNRTPFITRELTDSKTPNADYSFWFSGDITKWTSSSKKMHNDKFEGKRREYRERKRKAKKIS